MCDFSPDREFHMVVIDKRGTQGRAVWCDPCIADLVAALNAAGLATVASCCGHGRSDGSILMADGRELLIRPFTPEGDPSND